MAGEAIYDESGAQVRTVRTKAGDKLSVNMDELMGPDSDDLKEVVAAIKDPKATWIVSHQNIDNAGAYQQKNAEVGKSHYIVAAGFSFNDAAIDGLKGGLKEGADTQLLNHFVKGSLVLEFPVPLKIIENNSIQVWLEASGTAGKLGSVWMIGFTK